MSRYVLVEFDDNDDADSFLKEFEKGEVFWMHKDFIYKANVPMLTRIRGMFGKPTKFCDCPDVTPDADKSVQGAKWGWWLHRVCGKPKKGRWQHPKNMLDPETPTKFRELYLGIVEPAGIPHYKQEEYKEWVAKYS